MNSLLGPQNLRQSDLLKPSGLTQILTFFLPNNKLYIIIFGRGYYQSFTQIQKIINSSEQPAQFLSRNRIGSDCDRFVWNCGTCCQMSTFVLESRGMRLYRIYFHARFSTWVIMLLKHWLESKISHTICYLQTNYWERKRRGKYRTIQRTSQHFFVNYQIWGK